MKTIMKGAMRDEKGKVLIMVLILLVVGGLIIPPLLGLMSTGLHSGRVYETKMHEYYAADAGVEIGKLAVLNGTVETFQLNRSVVEVVIEEEPFDADKWEVFDLAEEYRVFCINSTASFIGGDSSTKIECHYGIIPVFSCIPDPDLPPPGSNWTDYSGSGDIQGGYVKVGTGDEVVNIQGASVWNTGGFDMTGNIQGADVNVNDGDLNTPGDVQEYSLEHSRLFVFGDCYIGGSIQNESILYVSGDLTVEGNIQEGSVVYVDGNLTVVGNIEWHSSYGDSIVGVKGNLIVEKGEIQNDVYVAGNVTLVEKGEDGWKNDAEKLGLDQFPADTQDPAGLNNFQCPLETTLVTAGDAITLALSIT